MHRFPRARRAPLLALAGVLSLLSCSSGEPELEPEEPRLRRLTEAQYTSSIHDVLGQDIFVPTGLEPDHRLRGFLNVGASSSSISPRGVERFEQAAYIVAEQAMEPGVREAIVGCELSGEVDDPCLREALARLGLRFWRRPLVEAELEVLSGIARTASATLDDPWDGFEFALASLLQAPQFLYRVELGRADPQERWARAFDDWELASRLSFLLWNTTPDEELLAAAAAGELSTDPGLALQVERLLDSPRSREGMSSWFGDMMQLAELDSLYKDPLVFLHMSDSLGASAAGETLRSFEHLAFDEDGDLRDLATTRTTFLNRELAALYEVPAPDRDDYGAVEYPINSQRLGLLGQASFLTLTAHPVSTSPTLRGKFIREVLLCQHMEAPLADVDTSIPPVTEQAPTLRERVAQHLSDSGCAGCHDPMDNVGLGLENFDGIGRFRTHDNDALIDASGRLDEFSFRNPIELARLLRDHEDFASCLVRSFVRYANGYGEEEGQLASLDWLTAESAQDEHRLTPLLESYVYSSLFRQAGPLVPVGPEPVLVPLTTEDPL